MMRQKSACFPVASSVAASLALTASAAGAAQEVYRVTNPDMTIAAETDQTVVVDRQDLPDGFPSDVPLFDAMKSPTIARSASTFMIRGQTTESGERTAQRLKNTMAEQGWERRVDGRTPTEYYMTFAKGDREVGVTLTLENQVTLLRMDVPRNSDREATNAGR